MAVQPPVLGKAVLFKGGTQVIETSLPVGIRAKYSMCMRWQERMHLRTTSAAPCGAHRGADWAHGFHHEQPFAEAAHPYLSVPSFARHLLTFCSNGTRVNASGLSRLCATSCDEPNIQTHQSYQWNHRQHLLNRELFKESL